MTRVTTQMTELSSYPSLFFTILFTIPLKKLHIYNINNMYVFEGACVLTVDIQQVLLNPSFFRGLYCSFIFSLIWIPAVADTGAERHGFTQNTQKCFMLHLASIINLHMNILAFHDLWGWFDLFWEHFFYFFAMSCFVGTGQHYSYLFISSE